jgi:hypothetical protein
LVLARNIWSGSLLPILVTLVGRILLIRGVLFLFLSNQEISRILEVMQFGTFFYVYLSIPCLTNRARLAASEIVEAAGCTQLRTNAP